MNYTPIVFKAVQIIWNSFESTDTFKVESLFYRNNFSCNYLICICVISNSLSIICSKPYVA